MSFLAQVLDAVFPPRVREHTVRQTSLETFPCVPYITDDTVIPVTALASYRTKSVEACILEAKFHRNSHAYSVLGAALREYLIEYVLEHQEFGQGRIVLVPIPLSRLRRKSRQYNQVEEVCTRAVHALPGVCLAPEVLIRTRDTTPQMTLRRAARLENMHDAFKTSSVVSMKDTYIVVDDVVTTGATLSAAVQALQESGAVHVIALALAH